MRTRSVLAVVAVGLATQVLASGCLVFPELKDKVVELATTGSVVTDFHAEGNNASYSQDTTIDIRDNVDVAQVLSDAGIDVSNVKSITLGGVAYRVTVADPDPSKQITSGNVTVQAGAAPSAQPLISNFTLHVGATKGWTTATLDPAGVTQLNDLLAAILAELQGGAAANEHIAYHVDGTISPAANTGFQYQLRLTLSIVGTVKVKTLG